MQSWGMSYPDPVYFGESGEVSATARRADAPPDLTYRNGGTVDYLATGATTDGGLGLYRWNFGTVKLFEGSEWVDAHPGDFFNVPPGGIHGFRNESGEPASMLLMFTPGAPREEYFETLKALGEGLTMTDEERDTFYLRHDNYWV
jgi:hypothetical protein